MGQELSTAITPPPLTLRDCLVNGRIDITRYFYYRRSLEFYDEMDQDNASTHSVIDEVNARPKKNQRVRSVKRHKLLVRDSNGSLREILSTDTLWYLLYITNPPFTDWMLKLFRLRFRLPYNSFIDLTETLRHHEKFVQWTKSDAVGVPSHDINFCFLMPYGI